MHIIIAMRYFSIFLHEDIAEYLSAGADMVLPKPFSVRLLQNLLDFVLSGNERQIVSRHPDCHLVEQDDNRIQWAPAVQTVENIFIVDK